MVNLADLPNAGPLSGSETLPMQQGTSAVGLTVNQLLSRAAGRALPFEIGGVRVGTVTQTGVGLGTPTPEAALHLRNDATATGIGTNPLIILQNSWGASFGERTEIHFRQNAQAIAAISASYTSYSSGQYAGELVFATKSNANSQLQERMTLDRDGRVLIGKGKSDTGVAGCEIHPQGGFIASRSDVSLNLTRLDNTGPVAVFRSHGTGVVGSVSVTATSTAYNTASDYRLPWKKGHVPLTGSGEFIDALNPRFFPEVGHAGFIAHQFAVVSPSSVTGEKDAVDDNGDPIFQQMDASSPDVMANIVAELQSLRQRVAALEGAA